MITITVAQSRLRTNSFPISIGQDQSNSAKMWLNLVSICRTQKKVAILRRASHKKINNQAFTNSQLMNGLQLTKRTTQSLQITTNPNTVGRMITK